MHEKENGQEVTSEELMKELVLVANILDSIPLDKKEPILPAQEKKEREQESENTPKNGQGLCIGRTPHPTLRYQHWSSPRRNTALGARLWANILNMNPDQDDTNNKKA